MGAFFRLAAWNVGHTYSISFQLTKVQTDICETAVMKLTQHFSKTVCLLLPPYAPPAASPCVLPTAGHACSLLAGLLRDLYFGSAEAVCDSSGFPTGKEKNDITCGIV